MALKKEERKDAYREISQLMLQGKNKEAFEKLTMTCADDTGLYILVSYDAAIKKLDDNITPQ